MQHYERNNTKKCRANKSKKIVEKHTPKTCRYAYTIAATNSLTLLENTQVNYSLRPDFFFGSVSSNGLFP